MLGGMPREGKLPPGIVRRPNGRLQAQVWSARDGRRLSKTFPGNELAAAKAWKRDTERALAKGVISAHQSPTLRAAAETFLIGATEGTVRTRSRQRYKPATIARYRRALERDLLPALGAHRLSEIRGGQLEQLVGKLQARGLAANSVRNALMPLQAIYRWALRRELVAVDPTQRLELPLDRGRRDRFATAQEVSRLIDALDAGDRPLWATAFYAGLRRGELMALRWSDVDLGAGVIRVEQSHDPEAGVTGETKSHAGRRRVPVPHVLRGHLVEHRMSANPAGQPLVFARSALAGRQRTKDGPFSDSGVNQRARKHWAAAGLRPIGLHECRHTYASLMIAAGVSAKALQTYMGHSSITTTYDRYGHLMPDTEHLSAAQLQAFLDAETERVSRGEPQQKLQQATMETAA